MDETMSKRRNALYQRWNWKSCDRLPVALRKMALLISLCIWHLNDNALICQTWAEVTFGLDADKDVMPVSYLKSKQFFWSGKQ